MPINTAVRWFAGFVFLCVALALIVVCYAVGADPAKVSTETGPWAMRLRVVEIMLLAITTGSVLLLIEQLNQTSRWNKRLTYHQFFKELPSAPRVERLRKLALEKAIDEHAKGDPIDPKKASSLVNDVESKQIITDYLNDFEEFCAAIRRGVIDDGYAYDIESARVTRAWKVFEPWILELRKIAIYVDSYSELQAIAARWEARDQKPPSPSPHV